MKAKIAKYHHNCKNNFSDYKLKKKIESTQKKRAKLSTDYSQNLCSSSLQSWPYMPPKKLNADHATKQTEQWRHIASTIGDRGLASRLSIVNVITRCLMNL